MNNIFKQAYSLFAVTSIESKKHPELVQFVHCSHSLVFPGDYPEQKSGHSTNRINHLLAVKLNHHFEHKSLVDQSAMW